MHVNDILNVSLLCVDVRRAVKSMIERCFTFKYISCSLLSFFFVSFLSPSLSLFSLSFSFICSFYSLSLFISFILLHSLFSCSFAMLFSLSFLTFFLHSIPFNTKMTTLSPQKVVVFSVSSIPCTATHVELILYDPQEFYDTLLTLPSTLTNLTLKSFREIVTKEHSPTLTCLSTGYIFKQLVDNLPPTLTHLTTGFEFNQQVDNLPPTLTHLTTGNTFNQPVDNLPPTLTHLTTGCEFNQPVDNLPPTHTHLTTGFDFNQPIDNLPPTLTHLTTGLNSTNQLIIFHLHSLTSQLDIISTNQLINFHSHSLI
jgi:FNIP Repeat